MPRRHEQLSRGLERLSREVDQLSQTCDQPSRRSDPLSRARDRLSRGCDELSCADRAVSVVGHALPCDESAHRRWFRRSGHVRESVYRGLVGFLRALLASPRVPDRVGDQQRRGPGRASSRRAPRSLFSGRASRAWRGPGRGVRGVPRARRPRRSPTPRRGGGRREPPRRCRWRRGSRGSGRGRGASGIRRC